MKLKISEKNKSRYRTRKGELATNVLGVCSQDMQFIYVLSGWEGSAADGRILRDALNKRHGLKVPHGEAKYHSIFINMVPKSKNYK